MANGLNLNDTRQGGEVTGSSLNLAGAGPSQASRSAAPVKAPSASVSASIPQPPAREQTLLEKPFSEFSGPERFLWALKSGLMGGNAAMAQKRRVMAAKEAHAKEVTDLMVKGLNAVKGIEDVDQRMRAGRAIATRLSRIGGTEAAQSFLDIFEEPAVQDVVFSDETIQEFGSVYKALAAREDDPSAFRARAVTANIGTIEQELLRLRETNPDVAKMDSNTNGTITASEARNWVRKRIKNKDTDLTIQHMNVIQMPEFEPFLADIFDARTTKATTGAQEKNLTRAINREGKLIFATEEEIRRDPSLTPEPKKALVQFGGEKREQALFESLVKRRDDLRQQAAGAQETMSLARIMRDTAMKVQTGQGTATISNLKSTAATLARLSGSEKLAERIADPSLTNAETLRSLNARAVQAFIASGPKQGSISNEERRKFELVAPGLATTQGGNIALSHIMEAMGASKVEEAAFVDTITDMVSRGQRDSDVGAQQAFQNYVKDLPYTRGEGAQIRYVNDGQSLWRYYTNGRPNKWMFSGSTRTQGSEGLAEEEEAVSASELTLEQIQAIAEAQGLTARELLAIADRKGTLLGVK